MTSCPLLLIYIGKIYNSFKHQFVTKLHEPSFWNSLEHCILYFEVFEYNGFLFPTIYKKFKLKYHKIDYYSCFS